MAKSKAWQQFERVVASTWGSFRVPLSGINSRHNAGDVILPDGVYALLECKTRQSSAHHTLWREAVEDAKKNGIDPEKTVLYFKQKSSHGYIVTLDGSLFERLLAIPQVYAIFQEPPREQSNPVRHKQPKKAPSRTKGSDKD